MKDNRWHAWRRGFGPSCDDLVCLLGLAACAVAVDVGLSVFKYFFALAGAGALAFAAVVYSARGK